ncbi:MAG: hypothetical protein NTX00_05725 [Candidatus Parcubacteria bacterium]|nr:hypothetical protein [Candidatus Parcubacteria bacterium]
MLDNIFQQLALQKEHALVYSALLESGPLPAGKLAKRVNMPRSSLYGFLSDLSQKGLVLQSEKQGVKIWQASSPEKISEILNDQINQIEKTKTSFLNILPDLKIKQKTDFITPKFTFYEGQEGVRQIIKDVLLYRDLETDCFWPIKDMVESIGKEFLEEYGTKERIRRNIKSRIIVPQNKMIDIKKNPFFGTSPEFKREVRIAPKDVDYSMGYWAYGNKVAFISSKKEGFGFIVESVELRQLLKTQFDLIWQISKPVKIDKKFTEKFIQEI